MLRELGGAGGRTPPVDHSAASSANGTGASGNQVVGATKAMQRETGS